MRDRKVSASITVEATFMMPIFLFVVVTFLFFFQLFQLQEDIQESITRVSKLASQYGYVYEYLKDASGTSNSKEQASFAKQTLQGVVDGGMFKAKFLEYMGNGHNDSCIVGGIQGISFQESRFMKKDKDIEVVAIYMVRFPVQFFRMRPFTVVQRVHSRGFVGESLVDKGNGNSKTGQENKKNDEYVYITRTGTKYHKNPGCTYIKVKITKLSGSKIKDKRNSSGAKYYPCESCMSGKAKENGTYCITQYGTRYHASSKCNKIERDVKRVKRSEVGGRGPCSKCAP